MLSPVERAIEELEKQKQAARERCINEITQLDETIATLRATLTTEASPPVVYHIEFKPMPGKYDGLKKAVALQSYLNEIGGGPVPVKKAVSDLLACGADLGQIDRQERNLKIVIANNSRLFRYNEKNDTVELIGKRKVN
jgi:hypothetical protein